MLAAASDLEEDPGWELHLISRQLGEPAAE
jgi:hypothetical protein